MARNSTNQTDSETQTAGSTAKTISLTADHVYMPVDPMSPGWETAQETARYDRKVMDEDAGKLRVAKYAVHPDLADFLIGRDQAMEVPADR